MMATDREHIATLERMLGMTQSLARAGKRHVDAFVRDSVKATTIKMAKQSVDRWQAETKALEWVLEKVA